MPSATASRCCAPDVNFSDWDSTLEELRGFPPPVGRDWEEGSTRRALRREPLTATASRLPSPHGERVLAPPPRHAAWPATSAPRTPSVSASARSRAFARTTRSRSWPRAARGYDSVRDLWLRSGLAARRRSSGSPMAMPSARSASTGARRCGRRAASARDGAPTACRSSTSPSIADIRSEPDFALPPMPIGEHVVNDYRYLSCR